MKIPAGLLLAAEAALGAGLAAQETKPVPKDSIRAVIPGCTKGHIFTAARRTEGAPGNVDVPEGTHLRMNGPKKLMSDIKAHEGSMIEITGLMKRSQYRPGVRIGGVTISPGATSNGGGMGVNTVGDQIMIDVEGWRQIAGGCPTGR